MGWIGNALVLVGLWQIGRKLRSAFLWTFVGETLWAWVGYQTGQVDLCLICCLFSVMAIFNWLRWGKEADEEKR